MLIDGNVSLLSWLVGVVSRNLLDGCVGGGRENSDARWMVVWAVGEKN
jgi:hypothetical protein